MTQATGINRRELIVAARTVGLLTTYRRSGQSRAATPTHTAKTLLAPKPPMGWNSWNSFATTITEAQAIANAEIMAREFEAVRGPMAINNMTKE